MILPLLRVFFRHAAFYFLMLIAFAPVARADDIAAFLSADAAPLRHTISFFHYDSFDAAPLLLPPRLHDGAYAQLLLCFTMLPSRCHYAIIIISPCRAMMLILLIH